MTDAKEKRFNFYYCKKPGFSVYTYSTKQNLRLTFVDIVKDKA